MFFGPNNSGKSLISRLIHGVNAIPVSKQGIPLFILRRVNHNEAKALMPKFYNSIVLKNSGINRSDIITYKKNCFYQYKKFSQIFNSQF